MIKRLYYKYEKQIFIVLVCLTLYFMFAKGVGAHCYDFGYNVGTKDAAEASWAEGYSAGVTETSLKYSAYKSPDEVKEIEAERANKSDARAIAKVLYGVNAYGLSTKAKEAIIEVILSRVECPYGEFGNTIKEVCEKEKQWEGYTGDFLEEDYELAMSVLNYPDRGRVTPNGCLYLTCSRGRVEVRKEWNSKSVWEVE